MAGSTGLLGMKEKFVELAGATSGLDEVKENDDVDGFAGSAITFTSSFDCSGVLSD